MSDEQTRAFYDAEADAYTARARMSPRLVNFISELPLRAAALDLGCGGGQDAAAMRDAGHNVTAIDTSTGLAAEAKRLWNIDVRVLDFANLDYAAAFDGIWASATLHHAGSDELPAIFMRLRQALKAEGILHASLKAAPCDRRDRFGRFYCAMDERRLMALVSNWTEKHVEVRQGVGYDAEPTPWLLLRARA